jgi:hypothetical protein
VLGASDSQADLAMRETEWAFPDQAPASGAETLAGFVPFCQPDKMNGARDREYPN